MYLDLNFGQRQGYTKFFWNEVEEKFGKIAS